MYTQPYLALLDTTSQSISVSNTPQVVTFNTVSLASKIIVTSPSRFTVKEAGNYNLTLNFEVDSTSAGKTIDLWVRVNGNDVPNSNCKITLANANDQKDISHVLNFPMLASQYVEVWINGDSQNLSLKAFPIGAAPIRPATPSIYLVLEKLP